jgi:hypothetical protein
VVKRENQEEGVRFEVWGVRKEGEKGKESARRQQRWNEAQERRDA